MRVGAEALREEVASFVGRIDELYGLYLDATLGFKANAREILRGQEHGRKVIPTDTDPDSLPMLIGRGAPGVRSNVLLHATTQGEFKCRNNEGGVNHMRMAQWLIVLLYEYWETEHRERLARALGVATEEVKLPIFGDLRHLRHVVIHRRGIVDAESARKMEVLSGFQVGAPLAPSEDEIESLVRSVKAMLDALVRESAGSDPEHRKIWHVS